MKYVLGLLLLTCISGYSQNSVIRLYLEKPNQFYKQTIVAFLDSTSDYIDPCCDATYLAGGTEGIWSYIGTNQYAVNAFEYPNEDKLIQIGTSASPDTGLFIIGIDQINGDTLPLVLLDNNVPGYHTLPYVCNGPISNRFSLLIERPIQIEIVNGCEVGYVVIDNDEPDSEYYLTDNNNQTFILPTYSDTIYNLPSGEYTLSVYDSIPENVSFTVDNTVIDAVLNIPYTTLYLGDSYITPVLNIYSAYDYIEWDFGDGNFTQNDINPVHYYSQAGVYTLRAIVGLGECSKIFETQITVNDVLGITPNYRDFPKYRPATFYYAIDGKLVKRQ
jgi:hypothetical protein